MAFRTLASFHSRSLRAPKFRSFMAAATAALTRGRDAMMYPFFRVVSVSRSVYSAPLARRYASAAFPSATYHSTNARSRTVNSSSRATVSGDQSGTSAGWGKQASAASSPSTLAAARIASFNARLRSDTGFSPRS